MDNGPMHDESWIAHSAVVDLFFESINSNLYTYTYQEKLKLQDLSNLK